MITREPKSPLMQGRGSKHLRMPDPARGNPSPLMQGRGSKLIGRFYERDRSASPLMQGRGSKRDLGDYDDAELSRPSCRGVDRNRIRGGGGKGSKLSPLMQGRGSKQRVHEGQPARADVAPHAGAWIETFVATSSRQVRQSRPSCGGVDRNEHPCSQCGAPDASPLMQGRGSKRRR